MEIYLGGYDNKFVEDLPPPELPSEERPAQIYKPQKGKNSLGEDPTSYRFAPEVWTSPKSILLFLHFPPDFSIRFPLLDSFSLVALFLFLGDGYFYLYFRTFIVH